MNKESGGALNSWSAVVAEFERVAAIDSGFSAETLAQARQFLDFARTQCPIPCEVDKGYGPTISISWKEPAFEVEIFSDRLETYRFYDGRTDIRHWEHVVGQPYSDKFVVELPTNG